MNASDPVSSRRELLNRAGLAAAVMAGGTSVPALTGTAPSPAQDRKPVLRVAHLTDIHLTTGRNAPRWLTTCLHHAQERSKADLILNTGDSIFDAMRTGEASVQKQWELSQRIWKDECSLPAEHAIGNHDIWGIEKGRSKTSGSEPLYGKKWVMSIHGWEKPYRSFDRGGWHFIALDSTTPREDSFVGQLDEEQFAWLGKDLSRVNPATPVLIFSHIPLLSAAAFLFKGTTQQDGNWQVKGHLVHLDARRIKDLLVRHPNVRLCLSGHLHMVERVTCLGLTFLCNGAVCGAWWNGPHQEFAPGYGVVDLYADGSFENRYVTYGWEKT
jgi:3',5'-cyclic AMP phosphodiesterase CpdA